MTSSEIRKKFLDFFGKRGHTVVPSSSLIPDDPSVLLTTAGMQQFKKYYSELDPETTVHPSIGKPVGKNAVSCQKSFRTSDIDEVGDESHLTFFEMLGNFSFGGYFKEDAIKYAHEFITKEMGLEIAYVSVLGSFDEPMKKAPLMEIDEESERIWKRLGVKDVQYFGRQDNFWGPTGEEGPCGPTTEIYIEGSDGKAIEVWNIVFNEYYCNRDKSLRKLTTPGVDTGMGLERLAMVAQRKKTIFETDLFHPFGLILNRGTDEDLKSARIIADHLRASVFLLADGVRPSNKGAGYVLRRLIRRLMVHARKSTIRENTMLIPRDILMGFAENLISFYGDFYMELRDGSEEILRAFGREMDIFDSTLKNGFREFDRRFPGMQAQKIVPGEPFEPFIVGQRIGKDAFDLYQTYGFPIEVIKELLEERLYEFDQKGFNEKLSEEFKKHQEISRAGSEAKFGGHGLYLKTGEVTVRDASELEKVTRYHTATHLLHAALRAVLGSEVQQDGSDITIERTRFDFRFPRKVTPEELKKVEEWVNDTIKKDLKVEWEEMSFREATKEGALGFFREKYPERVKVYTVFDPKTGEVYSKELCGGPHVEHTGTIGMFKITKEESSSAGVRRVRGVIEP